MKNIILVGLMTLASSLALANLDINDVKDGQVLSVRGWKDMMPKLIDPSMPAAQPTADQLTVTFAAISGGCTGEKSFKVELKKLTADTYIVSAVRTQQDFCEAVAHVVLLQAAVTAPSEIFNAYGTGKVRILTEPNVSIGVAY